jgi:thiamine kinase-like enzyme
MDNSFRHGVHPSIAADLEADAKLALNLVHFLISGQDQEDGSWPGAHMSMTLRQTCHALDALNLLHWDAFNSVIDNGVAWLVNLSDNINVDEDDTTSIRLYPSRFKTLAWLEHFKDDQIRSEFNELGDYIDNETLLQNLHIKGCLAQMIYLDCLNHLEGMQDLPSRLRERKTQILNALRRYLQSWHDDHSNGTHLSPLENEGDLSYALDLLLRAEHLAKADPLCQRAFEAMLTVIESPPAAHPMQTNTLYCAIQLATHFRENLRTRAVLPKLFHRLRTKYDRQDFQRESPYFHALLLRTLITYHGDHLPRQMISELLRQQHAYKNLSDHLEDQKRKDSFRALIRDRFDVQVSEVEELTGGITKAEVFRVHFTLQINTNGKGEIQSLPSEEHPSPFVIQTPSLVIKSDTQDALWRSVEQYRALPDTIKPYFARHTSDPQMLETSPRANAYLILEDLTHMQTFRQIVDRADLRMLAQPSQDRLQKSCRTIATSLFQIYAATSHPAQEVFGKQLSRLYFSRIEQSLIEAIEPGNAPHLKDLYRGFWLDQRRYFAIDHYLQNIERFKGHLKIPCLMLIHGDCHCRNIMLNPDLSEMKLIDLDKVDSYNDYIFDIAQLIEDVAVFRLLHDTRHHAHLGKEKISLSTDGKVVGTRILYPPFASNVTRIFQELIMSHVGEYAQKIEDKTWRERLWLALAVWLLDLTTKHWEMQHATVLYVEAIKLLDTLLLWLDNGEELPAIPFPGSHPAETRQRPLDSGVDGDGRLMQLHRAILSLHKDMRTERAKQGDTLRYFTHEDPSPFAIITSKQEPPLLLLACTPDQLDAPPGWTTCWERAGRLRTAITISEDRPIEALAQLAAQVLKIMGRSE